MWTLGYPRFIRVRLPLLGSHLETRATASPFLYVARAALVALPSRPLFCLGIDLIKNMGRKKGKGKKKSRQSIQAAANGTAKLTKPSKVHVCSVKYAELAGLMHPSAVFGAV